MFERKKVGLALSGGGAKGLAHIGVLKVLEEEKIPVDFISGTSMGAVIGALYCSEPNAKKIEKEALSRDWKELFDYTIPTCGFIKGDRLEKFFKERLKNIDFKDLKIPLYITSFDIENNREIIFHRGEVSKAVRAAISIPGIFVPVENKRRILVDGALVDPVPTEILKKSGADIIIAVNVNDAKINKPITNEKAEDAENKKKMPNIITSSLKSMQIMESEASKADLVGDKADLIITINLEEINALDFGKSKHVISTGEKEAKKSLDEIKKLTENPFKIFLDSLNPEFVEKSVKKIVKDVEKNISVKKYAVNRRR